ncbi:response regulator [Waterburya agarophytonicola K14]|uniref:Response regulator n=1 Tax=Waterburya agarophytonicola KI4 TaxID=2874699 RepID=A0A964FIA8_9CYAN|nr:response regulator [Waterburya agarophytonicola]MCC0178304.1 response regulator [Waterburya agarophytonicola KI4]
MVKAKILVVDDEKNIRRTVTMALESLDYFVHTALDGKDAMFQLTGEEYDLIITDLKMPKMNGLEVLQQAIAKYPDIKVILISAYSTVDNIVEATKLGAIDFLPKPFTAKQLRDVVYKVLERETISKQQESEFDKALELAKYYASKRQFNHAINAAKQAIGHDPARPEAFDFLGQLQEASGDTEAAIKNYRIALSLDPTYQTAKDNLRGAENQQN